MTNPALSGRGAALAATGPVPRLVLEPDHGGDDGGGDGADAALSSDEAAEAAGLV